MCGTAIVDHLRADGWRGAWVNALCGDLPLRSEAHCLQLKSRSMTSAPRRSSGTITFR
jgi:hypothetical protein